MPARVRGDKDRLKQVLLNLLSNAIKFTQGGEVEVRAKVESETATHHSLKVSVRDTGIGIPQDAQLKLFARFMQVDNSTTRNYGGTGLGLAISKQLVELMSGTIGVTSIRGKGSTFWFSIPLEKVETSQGEVRQLPTEMRPMLVVSRNSSMRNMLTSCLENWGADVCAATDEKEAVIYLHRTGTAIISLTLLDNGIAVLKPILDFITASVTKVRFWILLCPIIFVGKIRVVVADMAKAFAAKGKTLAEHAALGIVIMSSPVKHRVLYDCVTQLHASGVYEKGAEPITVVNTCLQPGDDALTAVSGGGDAVGCNLGTGAPSFKVLVAEDSVAYQMALQRLLSKHGADVTVVADGGEAVDLVVTQGVCYNLALFDLNMAVMGGVEAMHRISDAAIELPIIAMTASSLDEAQSQSYVDEGFSMVITKPLRVSMCLEILARYGHVLPFGSNKQQPAMKSPSSFSSTRALPRDDDLYADGGDIIKRNFLVLVVEDDGGVTHSVQWKPYLLQLTTCILNSLPLKP
jgi:CheY-like chemotaxis protein